MAISVNLAPAERLAIERTAIGRATAANRVDEAAAADDLWSDDVAAALDSARLAKEEANDIMFFQTLLFDVRTVVWCDQRSGSTGY